MRAFLAAVEVMPLPENVDRHLLWQMLFARESLQSTGVGEGIAIPHVRNPMVHVALSALWIAEKLASRRTLVLVPSLSLISQTLTEWGRNAAEPFDYLVVCSDETVVHRGENGAVTRASELGVPVTTDDSTLPSFR